jgi:hypothetical protein
MMPERRLVSVGFLVDTNCVNAKQKIAEMNLLETWAANEIIELIAAETAQHEMAAGRDSDRTRKAYQFIVTMSAITTPQERQQVQRIEQILCPNGVTTQNERNDIDIVFNSGKYGRPLITNDGGSKTQPGGILGNRAKLAQLGIRVLRPEEAVVRVQTALCERDNHAQQWAAFYKKDLPDWVGKD